MVKAHKHTDKSHRRNKRPATSESDEKVEDQATNKNNESEESESEEDDKPTSNNKINEIETSDSEEEDEVNSRKIEEESSHNKEKIKNLQDNINEEVKDNEERTVHVLNIHQSIKKKHLHQIFSKYGEVEELTLKLSEKRKLGICSILFKNRKDAVKSLEINGLVFKGLRFYVRLNDNSKILENNSVSVKCGTDIDSNALWHAFQSFGVIKRVIKVPKKGFAIVSFETIDSVEITLKMGTITIGDQKLNISAVKKDDIPTNKITKSKTKSAVPARPRKFPKKAFNQQSVGSHNHYQQPTQPRQYYQQSAQGRNYRQQPGRPNNYHQQPGRSNNYHQQSRQPNNYHQQPGRSNNYHQQSRQPNNYHQQPGRSNNYHQQSRQPNNYHQQPGRPNNYHQQPTQLNRYQGYSGAKREFAQQPQQTVTLEDVCPGILVHKHKFGPNAFTITFNGNKLQ